MQRANALRRAAHACMSTQAGGSIPHSALAYRALLRNLKLLQGMRPKNEFQLLLAGYEAAGAAPIFRSLEPQLRVHIVGDEHGVHADKLAEFSGKNIDAAILLQPFHILRSGNAGSQQWKALRACLHDEDGAVGMLWTRAPPQRGWYEAFTAAASSSPSSTPLDLGTPRGLLPPLSPSHTPMLWMDTVDLAGYGFKQCKHRKFVEQIQGGPKELMPLVRRVHDARFSPQDSAACPEFEAGAAAAVAYAQQHGSAQPLALDLHGFHAPVIPMKRKA